jgi:hypothetical protein
MYLYSTSTLAPCIESSVDHFEPVSVLGGDSFAATNP